LKSRIHYFNRKEKKSAKCSDPLRSLFLCGSFLGFLLKKNEGKGYRSVTGIKIDIGGIYFATEERDCSWHKILKE